MFTDGADSVWGMEIFKLPEWGYEGHQLSAFFVQWTLVVSFQWYPFSASITVKYFAFD